jgi:predicted ATPase/class 3 adenylate cyclase
MTHLPTGTVTFLFTDVEGSTRLLEEHGEDRHILEDQARLIRKAVAEAEGVEVSTEGDSIFAVFASAPNAVNAAVGAQRVLAAWPWPEGAAVGVRMGLHTGEGVVRDDSYRGLDVHRAARIASAAHGGQVVLSEATRGLAAHALPAGTTLRDLGEHRLKDLTRPEHLYQLAIEGLVSEFPPIETLEMVPHNLPVQLTSFIGRSEVGMVKDLLIHNRLVTLTGSGGSGKTRLSLEVAAEVAHNFRHGAWFVPLDAIKDPELVSSAIATSLRLTRAHRPPLEHLMEYLEDKQLLLVLDNFEQVLPAAVSVSDLLRAATDVKILVTSRAPLHIYGEHEFFVPPLAVPDPEGLCTPQSLVGYEAVALFVERAVAVRPDFEVNESNAQSIAAITARLDGLPLAIELAAARVRMMSPEMIAQRLGNRLAFLTDGSRDLPARQRTLRDAIAWSYDLLPAEGQRMLARLAVFSGGGALEEIEKVADPVEPETAVMEALEMLVDQSLLRHEEVLGSIRFRLLETIREFAWERLEENGDASEIRRRHTDAYVAVAELSEPHLVTKDQARWLDSLELEHDNLRAALDWAVEQREIEAALRLVGSLWRFWQFRGHLNEAGDRASEALALPGGSAAIRAKACEAAGGVAYWRGDIAACRRLYRESLDLARGLGDRAGEANALYNLSFSYLMTEGAGERARLRTEALKIYEELDDRHGIAKVLWSLGSWASSSGDLERARSLLEQSLSIFTELDDPFGLGWVLYSMATNEFLAGDPEASLRFLREGLTLFGEVRDVSAIVLHLDSMALVSWSEGRHELALRLAGATARFGERSGVGLADPEFDQAEFAALRAELMRAAGEPEGADLLSEGAAMSQEEVVAFALREDDE